MQVTRPKSVAENAFNEVTTRVTRGFQAVDEFTRIRLEKAAQDGLNADPAVAHQVLGIIAATQWNHAKVDEHFDKALRLAPRGTTYCNYAATLVTMNRLVEAAKRVEMASLCEPTNLAYLRMAVNTCWHAGLWERSMSFAQQLKTRSPKEEMSSIAHRWKAMEIVERRGVSAATIEWLYNTVYEFLSARRIQVKGWTEDIDPSPCEETIFETVEIDGTYAEVAQLDEELTPFIFGGANTPPISTLSIDLGVYKAGQ
jgi:Tfp pilus assembly protein PilF